MFLVPPHHTVSSNKQYAQSSGLFHPPSLLERREVLKSKSFNFFLGGIFDQGDPSAKAFQFAVDMINEDRSLLVRTRLIPSVFEIPEGDSFKASKQGQCKTQ